MTNREALTKASRVVIADTPQLLSKQFATSHGDELSGRGAREERWAAGFVTSKGTHIRLFVRSAPLDSGEAVGDQ